ncbi:Hypothetical Protein MfeM64YM_0491 [Mycoplasmopsis fermentans M64]|uniref:Uncharacterized protein n=1 Tax=Mycoplasmopsis fermentans (strain M64) TaxID=943945 RepID=A0AB32XBT0_MYCFM|nr:Hypothetical Protein MfeM64YM_0491 [Mycoplasmopsis fermentans M64]
MKPYWKGFSKIKQISVIYLPFFAFNLGKKS